jgi:hypothetical protein
MINRQNKKSTLVEGVIIVFMNNQSLATKEHLFTVLFLVEYWSNWRHAGQMVNWQDCYPGFADHRSKECCRPGIAMLFQSVKHRMAIHGALFDKTPWSYPKRYSSFHT